jgi:hypothetical protein
MNDVIFVISIIALALPLFYLTFVLPIVILYDDKIKPAKIMKFLIYNSIFLILSICNLIILMK